MKALAFMKDGTVLSGNQVLTSTGTHKVRENTLIELDGIKFKMSETKSVAFILSGEPHFYYYWKGNMYKGDDETDSIVKMIFNNEKRLKEA